MSRSGAPLTFKLLRIGILAQVCRLQGLTGSVPQRKIGSERSFAASAANSVGLTFIFQRAVRRRQSSEFGRRVKENGSLGTDHGAGSQLFVVTPTGKGGVKGKHPSLTDLHQGDLKFHTDFRSVYATLLSKWLDYPSEPILGGKFPTIDVA